MDVEAENGARSAPAGSTWRRGRPLVLIAVLLALVIALHELVPNRWGNLGSLVATFLPWFVLAVPLLLLGAALRRSALAALLALAPLAAWVGVFGPQLMPVEAAAYDLTVVQHNVADDNDDVARTVELLLAEDPDIVALEELTSENLPQYEAALEPTFEHHTTQGTVGLWSRHPISERTRVDIRPAGIDASWDRCLRAVVQTPEGEVTVYVAHLPSVRVGPRGLAAYSRNRSAELLGEAIAADPAPAVVLAGDLNGNLLDPGLAPLTEEVSREEHGFRFTFPSALPVVQLDHVLARGAEVRDLRVLPRSGSDHLPVVSRVSLGQ
ncbi:endonuclease/exonuclease/phosphatase family protein [Nocardioides sp. YR527]|uniref:endonuclease/exonuclease/phosphatase family protein n=1 Tax=Nocardioides sp. YR527 TaxID=1881028 RepID=UPI001C408D78|nr:endonuclease/exonuclease/phosphatase family protein [Nocardioides sp. YR527]